MDALAGIITPTSLMYSEERLTLYAAAGLTPAHGTIVEVGTWRGASSVLMRQAADPTCRFYAVDPAPQPEAAEILAAHNVTLFQGTSRQFAEQLQGDIDLLLIDGDHSFHWGREDITALAPRLKPNAIVLFHDSKCLEHWGIRLVVEALFRQGTLRHPDLHMTGLTLGRFDAAAGLPDVDTYVQAARDHLSIPANLDVWGGNGKELFWGLAGTVLSLPRQLDNVRIIGKGLRGWIIKTLFDLPGTLFIDSDQATDPSLHYIVASHYWSEVHHKLTVWGNIPAYQVKELTDFTVSRMLYEDLLHKGGRVSRLARDDFQREFLDRLFSDMPGHELFALHQNGMLVSFISGLYRGGGSYSFD